MPREKKSTLWRKFKSILRPYRLLRRDGLKFKLVKKYKTTDGFHPPSARDKSPRPPGRDKSPRPPAQDKSPRPPAQDKSPCPPARDKSSRPPAGEMGPPYSRDAHQVLQHTDFGIDLCQEPITREHILTTHRPRTIPRPGSLKKKTMMKRNQRRRLSHFRVLRGSVEKMGNRLPAVKRHNVSQKNYVRVQDSAVVGDETAPSKTKLHVRRARAHKKREMPLLEHPQEMAASERCEMLHSATPEVLEVFSHHNRDLSTDRTDYLSETSVRILMTPLLPTTSSSPAASADLDTVHDQETVSPPAKGGKRPSSRNWCSIM